MSWDDNFGDWQGLDRENQYPRYQRIAQLIQDSSLTSVLDIGCGEAILQKFLSPLVSYTGVEPSSKAAYGRPFIYNCRAEDFDSRSKKWDCIVFNEVLYYLRRPMSVLMRCSEWLRPGGGIFLVSIYQNPRRPPLSTKLLGLLDSGRLISNVHCSAMFDQFLSRHHWHVVRREDFTKWRIWIVAPFNPRQDADQYPACGKLSAPSASCDVSVS